MTGFIIKIIAVITMFLDHVKYAIPDTQCFLTQYFGRIAFPLFAFFIAEGLAYTKDRKKYITRMTIFAIISQIPFMLFKSLFSNSFMFNVMFTFLLAMIEIYILEFFEKQTELPNFLKYIIIIFTLFSILFCGNYMPVDYRWFGIATVWIFYLLREKKILKLVLYAITVVIYYLYRNGFIIANVDFISVLFTISPILIILLYNGKQGKKLKYFFYLFYPVHMLILYGLSFIF